MDFTAGLMPLETALSQMLDRITPLHDVETLPLVRCFGRNLLMDSLLKYLKSAQYVYHQKTEVA